MRTSALAQLPWLKIYGTAPGKGAIFSFTIDGLHPHDVSTIIDRSGVAIRAGHHCAQPLMERLGVTATCRASFAMYSTRAEVDALVAALTNAPRSVRVGSPPRWKIRSHESRSEAADILKDAVAALDAAAPSRPKPAPPAIPPEELDRLTRTS